MVGMGSSPVVRVTVNVAEVDALKVRAGEESALRHALDLARVPGAARSARTVDLTESAAIDLQALAFCLGDTPWAPHVRALQDDESALNAWVGHLGNAPGPVVIELDGRGRVDKVDGVGPYNVMWDEQRGMLPVAPEIAAC